MVKPDKSKSLYQVQTAQEVKKLSADDLKKLADTIRHDIIQFTAMNGGHTAPSLGCVDIIVALHRVFETPQDAFVFDVGHQAYAHKMLTGRRFHFYTLRKENGLSGFPSTQESEHDAFGVGHASTSISVALGILEGKKKKNDDHHVVALLGDGSLTGGLAFEALNHAGELNNNLIVILNDNEMSIDPNVGGLKDSFKENKAKYFFNSLGLDYWGPDDGHDITRMIRLFEKAKKHTRPLVIHLKTIKGLGYQPAENDVTRFHGLGPFDLETGAAIVSPKAKQKYQDLFSQTLVELASVDDSIVAITAAMPSGTSLNKFKKIHPDKFYDVGMAESHAVTFASGLATQGLHPFVCIYSTFMQRAYDQLIHDVAVHRLPLTFCMDRGGLVGDDGVTHQGVFDYAFLRTIPHFVVMAPKDEAELQHMMETARSYKEGPTSIRFPRGEVRGVPLPKKLRAIPIGKAEHVYGNCSGDVLILAIGEPVHTAVAAAKQLECDQGLSVSVVNLRFAKPLDEKMIIEFSENFGAILTVEEGIINGGVGSAIVELLVKNNVKKPIRVLGIPDIFITHATQMRQREMCGLDRESLVFSALDLIDKPQPQFNSDRKQKIHRIPLRVVSSS
ncbi:MAG: 1-deoxy-D-xylulose-5-phosphate synthase [bacterium]|nr:1-deoxy-D-xylulose-5-phosphate synthase [bacterium]